MKDNYYGENKDVEKMFKTYDIKYSKTEKAFQKKRLKVLNQFTKKEWTQIDTKITKNINKFLEANKDKNFDIRELIKIKEIKKYYPINILISRRGIGKTVSSKRLCEEYAEKRKGHFIWLRSTQSEADKFVSGETTQWFKDNLWYCMKSTGIIFRSYDHYLNFRKINKLDAKKDKSLEGKEDAYKKKLLSQLSFDNIDEEVVGYVEGLYSAGKQMRSMEKRGARLIIYDEFQLWKKKEDQLSVLCDYLETVIRRKQNFNLILCANYQDVFNPLILALQKNRNKTIEYNRVIGSIILNVPKEYFVVSQKGFTLAERISLSSRENYVAREGDEYDVEENNQVIKNMDRAQLKDIKPFAIIVSGFLTYNLFSFDGDKILIGDKYWIQLRESNNITKWAFNKKDWLRNPDYSIIKDKQIKTLISFQKSRKIFYNSERCYECFIETLNTAQLERHKEDKFDIDKI